jgi:hypothetical protein
VGDSPLSSRPWIPVASDSPMELKPNAKTNRMPFFRLFGFEVWASQSLQHFIHSMEILKYMYYRLNLSNDEKESALDRPILKVYPVQVRTFYWIFEINNLEIK